MWFFHVQLHKLCTKKDLDIQFYDENHEFENFFIASMYRHPSINDSFLKYLQNTLIKIKKEDKIVFLTHDFNLNILKFDTNDSVKEFLDIIYTNCFQPTTIHPTRIAGNAKPSLIDNIFTNVIDPKHI